MTGMSKRGCAEMPPDALSRSCGQSVAGGGARRHQHQRHAAARAGGSAGRHLHQRHQHHGHQHQRHTAAREGAGSGAGRQQHKIPRQQEQEAAARGQAAPGFATWRRVMAPGPAACGCVMQLHRWQHMAARNSGIVAGSAWRREMWDKRLPGTSLCGRKLRQMRLGALLRSRTLAAWLLLEPQSTR
eukprot:356457-Chlamydomonas_euryale.AAC.2